MDELAFQNFKNLFKGRENCFGVHIPEEAGEAEEKKKGRSYTETKPLTEQQYLDHINGSRSLGVVPLRPDQSVFFAAIDVDVYPCDPKFYVSFFNRYRLPFFCFRSKSGGLHAYIFFSRAEKAYDVIALLNEVKFILGLPTSTETFPKQANVEKGAYGNWINLPYYNAEHTERYMYDEDGRKVLFKTATGLCWDKRTTLEELQARLVQIPFSEGPPCLQRMYLSGEVREKNHNRNRFLFNVCTYLKSRNRDDYDKRLLLVNKTLAEPVSDSELKKTVLNSQEKGDYSYQCDEPLLQIYCYEALCKNRPHGKGSAAVSDVNFEELVQVRSDPPYYKWKINGVFMKFYSETDLRRQDKFQNYCIRELHTCPNTLKQSVWYGILNRALKRMTIENVEEDENLSDETIFLDYLTEFFTDRPLAKDPMYVEIGQVYYDKNTEVYLFKATELVKYMCKFRMFQNTPMVKFYEILKARGGKVVRYYYNKRQLRVWALPAAGLGVYPEGEVPSTDKKPADIELDYVVEEVEKSKKKAEAEERQYAEDLRTVNAVEYEEPIKETKRTPQLKTIRTVPETVSEAERIISTLNGSIDVFDNIPPEKDYEGEESF